jgi:hypothetical protein
MILNIIIVTFLVGFGGRNKLAVSSAEDFSEFLCNFPVFWKST